MSYQLPEDSEKAKYVQQKFSEIAPKYDLFNDLITCGLHRYWKKFVVRQVGVIAGGRYLDLCCGTADIARRLQHMIPQGSVFALDFSRAMLEIARQSRYTRGRSMIFSASGRHPAAIRKRIDRCSDNWLWIAQCQ